MDIIIRQKTPKPQEPRKPASPFPYGKRLGEWGRVEAAYSDDNTVDVTLASGLYLERVPVASREWVVSGDDAEKEWNSGERNLPPVHARVFVLMPGFTYDDCFVLPFSGFSIIDQTAPFMGEGMERVGERITPSGWHVTDDHVTGSHRAISPDKKTVVEIDYGTEREPKEDPELHLSVFDDVKVDVTAGEKATVKIFDTEIVIKPGKVLLKPKDTAIEVDGNATLKTTGNTVVEATASATVKGATVTLEASTLLKLQSGDAVAWCPNTVINCPWGFPHGGPGMGIVRLQGG